MAKRGRATSVDKLLARLKELDRERVAVMAGIKAAVGHIFTGDAPGKAPKKAAKPPKMNPPVPDAPVTTRAPMSAEARAKIAAAQRRRWAKHRKAAQ